MFFVKIPVELLLFLTKILGIILATLRFGWLIVEIILNA